MSNSKPHVPKAVASLAQSLKAKGNQGRVPPKSTAVRTCRGSGKAISRAAAC